MAMGGDIQDWFKSLPFFTRYWFGGTVLFTLLGKFGILPPAWLVLLWEPLWHRFHIWRPVTAIFFYPLSPKTGFHFLINLYFMYNYSIRYARMYLLFDLIFSKLISICLILDSKLAFLLVDLQIMLSCWVSYGFAP